MIVNYNCKTFIVVAIGVKFTKPPMIILPSFSSGLYYKHLTIVNYASSSVNQLRASLNHDATVVIYDRHMFKVQATGKGALSTKGSPKMLQSLKRYGSTTEELTDHKKFLSTFRMYSVFFMMGSKRTQI
jgi:hypothetical protein